MKTRDNAVELIPELLEKSGRSVFKILTSSHASMGKMGLRNVIQGHYQNYVSPFYLFDEFGPLQLPQGAPFRVDAHPHAGIIPTTYLFKGNAHHRDSMGNDFQYSEGDFIQFTSGKGALHMEETGDELFRNGGTFHGIQSWLSIPSRLKKSEPAAGHIKKEDIGVVITGEAVIRVILGQVFGVKSGTRLLMPVIYWHVSLRENGRLNLPIDPAQNAFIYLLSGQLKVDGNREVRAGQAVLYERNGDHLAVRADTAADFMVLGGEANMELQVASGPFVLNSEEEIMKAYHEFEMGKFGDLAKTNGTKREHKS